MEAALLLQTNRRLARKLTVVCNMRPEPLIKKPTAMKKYIMLIQLALLLFAHSIASASLFTVDAYSNSSTGGVGLDTGITLLQGQTLSVTADPNDLWSAGALPRWSNADGLIQNLYATGADESNEVAGTLIGTNWPTLWTQSGLTAPFGSLVGEVGGTFFVIGSNFVGPVPASGTLKLYYWDMNNYDNSHSLADIDVSAVPEPGSFILVGVGLVALVGFTRNIKF